MTAAEAGWYPDPSGRYSLRYHDGTSWTNYVTDPAGSVLQDPNPLAPPPPAQVPPQQYAQEPQQTWAAQPAAAPQAWGAQPTYGAPTAVRDFAGLRTAATLVAGIGFVLTLLGLVLDVEWFVPDGGEGISLGDIRDGGELVGLDVFEGFLDGGWIVVAVLSAIAVVGAWMRGVWRWVGLGAAIAGLLYTMAAIGDVFDFDDTLDPGGGAGMTLIGLIAGIVGTAISRKPQL